MAELRWLNAAQWPDGIAWPEGPPSRTPQFARSRLATIVVPVIVGAILIFSPLPLAFAVVAFLLLGVLPNAAYITWLSTREAKRQGWGSNLR
jgi:hypothetical protein